MAQLKTIVARAVAVICVFGMGSVVACGSEDVGPEDAVDSEGGNANGISATGGTRAVSQSNARATGGRAVVPTTAGQSDFSRGGARPGFGGAIAQGGNLFPFNQGGNTAFGNTTSRRARNQGGADSVAAGGAVVPGFGGFIGLLQGGAAQTPAAGGRNQRTATGGSSGQVNATGGRGSRNTGGSSERPSATGGAASPTGGRGSSVAPVAVGGRTQDGSSAATGGRRSNRGGAGGDGETQPQTGVAGAP